MNDAYLPLSNEDGAITFLVGENGSGKSSELRRIALHFSDQGSTVVAISGSVFDRFPSKHNSRYHRLSPSKGRHYVTNAFKATLLGQGVGEEQRNSRLLARVLSYAGFLPEFAYDIEVGRSWTPDFAQSALARLDEINEIDRMLLKTVIDRVASRRNHRHINISRGFDLFKMNIKAVGKHQHLSGL